MEQIAIDDVNNGNNGSDFFFLQENQSISVSKRAANAHGVVQPVSFVFFFSFFSFLLRPLLTCDQTDQSDHLPSVASVDVSMFYFLP